MTRAIALAFAVLAGTALQLSPRVAFADVAEATYRTALEHKRAGRIDEEGWVRTHRSNDHNAALPGQFRCAEP